MKRNLAVCTVLIALTAAWMAPSANATVPLSLTQIVTGLNRPVSIAYVPNDPDRLFVVEKRGVIKIIDLTTNTVLPTPFLDISQTAANPAHRRVITVAGGSQENGMLGLAFHPNHLANAFFYVNYVDDSGGNGNTIIARYKLGGGFDEADPNSEVILRTIDQPEGNHNGGATYFGPDGKLYISTGDGGGGGDLHGPIGNGQNLQTLLGKMLRLDVDIAAPYIPADNPQIPDPNSPQPFALPEIWAFGLRNPWRFSFDRENGDLWIADVGQGAWEEVNHVSGASTGGENYGWRCMEGNACFTTPSGAICTCFGANLTDPIYVYSLAGTPCAVMGGYVYRGLEIPEQNGRYFYSDHCAVDVRSFDPANPFGTVVSHVNLADVASNQITSFGEDVDGNVYVAASINTADGKIYRIDPTCNTAGDINADCSTDLDDAEILVNVLLNIDPSDPALVNRSDVNDDGNTDGLDIKSWIDEI